MLRRIVRPAVAAVLFSLPLIAVGFVLLVPVVGMGHGWTGPVPLLFASFVLFPLAVARFRLDPRGAPWWLSVAISAAIIGYAVVLSTIAFVSRFLGEGLLPLGGFNLLGPLVLLGCIAVSLGVHLAMRNAVRSAIWGDVQLLVVAMWTDWVLYAAVMSQSSFGFRGNSFEYTWIGFWGIWQVIVMVSLIRHIRAARRAL